MEESRAATRHMRNLSNRPRLHASGPWLADDAPGPSKMGPCESAVPNSRDAVGPSGPHTPSSAR
eukprot:6196217-Prymnesium_polylepis.1